MIIEAVKDCIEETPAEIVNDIAEDGIYITGGSSLLRGLTNLLAKETKMPTVSVEDPLTSVVKGAMRILEEPSLLERVRYAGAIK